jgi:RNase P subunit RPR2
MKNILSRMCEACNDKQPYYNFPGQTKGRFCKSCAERLYPGEMYNTREDKKCKHCKETQAFYNFPGQLKGQFCKSCAEKLYPNQLVNVITPMCEECKNIVPNFNFPGQTKGRFCKTCAEKLYPGEMRNIRDRKCEAPNCGKTACYGIPGTFPTRCSPHKTDGMLFRPRKRCSVKKCTNIATHGITTPDTCETHSKTDYILLTERHCKQCQRLDVLNAQGVCVNFCSLDELDRKYKKHLKQKEDAIRKLFQKELQLDQTVIQTWEDSVVDSSCTRRRPDFVFHCGTHVVIVEVDEHQHKSYSNCGSTREDKIRGENRRMFEIFQSFQSLLTDSIIPVLFIRYNPDAYYLQGRKGKTSDKQRRETLVRWVRQSLGVNPLDSVPDPLSVLYLYYDEPVGPVGPVGSTGGFQDGFVKVDVQTD